MLNKHVIKDFGNRLKLLKEESAESADITTFAEVTITEAQMEIIADPMFGWDTDLLKDYYKGKIHGSLLLTRSVFTTREDQPDIQYLFDLGVQALAAGMVLKEDEGK